MVAGRPGPEAVDLEAPTWGFGDALGGLGLALLAPALVVVVALQLVGVGADDADTIPLWGLALLQIPLWLVLGGVPWWAARRKGSGSLRVDFGLAFRPRDIGIGLAAGVGSQIVLAIILIPVYQLLHIDQDEVGKAARSLSDRAHDPVAFISLFIVAVVAAALLEELFYRGLVLGALRKRWGDGVAIAGSALIFGVMHFQPVDTFALAIFGAVLAWLTIRYGRLGPAICAHLVFNLTAFISLVQR
jgi:membrane protease YdiL (CAAX protease family)